MVKAANGKQIAKSDENGKFDGSFQITAESTRG